MPKRLERVSDPIKPFWATNDGETVRLYLGDVLDVLRKLPSRSVQMVVTSPPYWGLRDYGTAEWEGGRSDCQHLIRENHNSNNTSTLGGSKETVHHAKEGFKAYCRRCGAVRIDQQIGSEGTPQEYVAKMVAIFREIRRILRLDGTVWLNLGDTYASSSYSESRTWEDSEITHASNYSRAFRDRMENNTGKAIKVDTGLPQGNLVGIPWRVAFALQEDGWILRQDICWSKPGPMPESMTNRCTKAHEYIFLLSQEEEYYFDAEAIKEESIDLESHNGRRRRQDDKFVQAGERSEYREGFSKIEEGALYQTRNKRAVWTVEDNRSLLSWLAENAPETLAQFLAESTSKLDVWRVSSAGYAGAHFAVFPPKLINPCILAGTSEYGCCAMCGSPYWRIVQKVRVATRPGEKSKYGLTGGGPMYHPPGQDHKPRSGMREVLGLDTGKRSDRSSRPKSKLTGGAYSAPGQTPHSSAREDGVNCDPQRHCTASETIGWQRTCACKTDEVRPCIVLDPFMGSGTTAVVCIGHNRYCWGIDLSRDYLTHNAIPRIEGEIMSRPNLASLVCKPVEAIPDLTFDKGDDLLVDST